MTELTPEQIAEGWVLHDGRDTLPLEPLTVYEYMDQEFYRLHKGVARYDPLDGSVYENVVVYRTFSPDRPALHSEAVTEVSCESCGGSGWVDDQNWEPRFPDLWPPDEREPGNGKIQCGICLGTGTVEPDQSAKIAELEAEVKRLRLELSLKRPTDMDVAQTHQARRDYRAKLKELYGNPDALPMEIARLKNALGQIASMKCFPDAAINMTTLTAARRIAEQALHTETREALGAAEMVCPTAHANGGHCPLHNLHCGYPACRTVAKLTKSEGAT